MNKSGRYSNVAVQELQRFQQKGMLLNDALEALSVESNRS